MKKYSEEISKRQAEQVRFGLSQFWLLAFSKFVCWCWCISSVFHFASQHIIVLCRT
jgi:hypothetical protein